MFRPVFCANILQCVVFKSSSWFLKISYSVLFFMLSKVENPCNCMNLSLALTLKLTAKKQKTRLFPIDVFILNGISHNSFVLV